MMPRFQVLGATDKELAALKALKRMEFIVVDEDPEYVMIINDRGVDDEAIDFPASETLYFNRSSMFKTDKQFAEQLANGFAMWLKRQQEMRYYRIHMTEGMKTPFKS